VILARYNTEGRTRLGIVSDSVVRPVRPDLFDPAMDVDREGVIAAVGRAILNADEPIPLEAVRLLAPVPRPGKIICIGANYAAHVEEAGVAVPAFPEVFAKFANTVTGPGDNIPVSGPDSHVDWEGELAVVIGRQTRSISAVDALEAVAGYMLANDVSARTWQLRVTQWVSGKSFDGFCPTGPWLVTPDQIGDPQQLRLRTLLNDEVVQDASTTEMIFPVADIISYLSEFMTLEPGDVILTGTPAGVGLSRTPPRFLRAGDRIAIEVTGIGRLENPVGG
jgi:acylpyruvate hydrolase